MWWSESRRSLNGVEPEGDMKEAERFSPGVWNEEAEWSTGLSSLRPDVSLYKPRKKARRILLSRRVLVSHSEFLLLLSFQKARQRERDVVQLTVSQSDAWGVSRELDPNRRDGRSVCTLQNKHPSRTSDWVRWWKWNIQIRPVRGSQRSELDSVACQVGSGFLLLLTSPRFN